MFILQKKEKLNKKTKEVFVQSNATQTNGNMNDFIKSIGYLIK